MVGERLSPIGPSSAAAGYRPIWDGRKLPGKYQLLFFSKARNLLADLLGEAPFKKTVFFRRKSESGGGVSPNPKFPNQKKIEIFLDFFAEGWGSHLFQKGFIIKC